MPQGTPGKKTPGRPGRPPGKKNSKPYKKRTPSAPGSMPSSIAVGPPVIQTYATRHLSRRAAPGGPARVHDCIDADPSALVSYLSRGSVPVEIALAEAAAEEMNAKTTTTAATAVAAAAAAVSLAAHTPSSQEQAQKAEIPAEAGAGAMGDRMDTSGAAEIKSEVDDGNGAVPGTGVGRDPSPSADAAEASIAAPSEPSAGGAGRSAPSSRQKRAGAGHVEAFTAFPPLMLMPTHAAASAATREEHAESVHDDGRWARRAARASRRSGLAFHASCPVPASLAPGAVSLLERAVRAERQLDRRLARAAMDGALPGSSGGGVDNASRLARPGQRVLPHEGDARTLRVFVYNTVSNSDAAVTGVRSYTLCIAGGVLRAAAADAADGARAEMDPAAPRLSQVLSSVVVELPGGELVEWARHGAGGGAADVLELRRPLPEPRGADAGALSVKVHLTPLSDPERFVVHPPLASLLDIRDGVAPRATVMSRLWTYVKAHHLDVQGDYAAFKVDAALREALPDDLAPPEIGDAVRVKDLAARLPELLAPVPPVTIPFEVQLDPETAASGDVCYDVPIAVRQPDARLDPLPREIADEISALNEAVADAVRAAEEHSERRDIFAAFSKDPAGATAALIRGTGDAARTAALDPHVIDALGISAGENVWRASGPLVKSGTLEDAARRYVISAETERVLDQNKKLAQELAAASTTAASNSL